MPAYVGNPLAGDPIWEASSASELRIAITTKQVFGQTTRASCSSPQGGTRRPETIGLLGTRSESAVWGTPRRKTLVDRRPAPRRRLKLVEASRQCCFSPERSPMSARREARARWCDREAEAG